MACESTPDPRLQPTGQLFGVASLKLLIVMEVNSKNLSRLLGKIVNFRNYVLFTVALMCLKNVLIMYS